MCRRCARVALQYSPTRTNVRGTPKCKGANRCRNLLGLGLGKRACPRLSPCGVFQKLFNQGMILAFAYEDAAGYKDRSANASLSPTRLVKTSRFRLTQVPTDEVEEKNGTVAKGECRDGVLAHRHGRAEADGACATSSRRVPTSSSSRLWRR